MLHWHSALLNSRRGNGRRSSTTAACRARGRRSHSSSKRFVSLSVRTLSMCPLSAWRNGSTGCSIKHTWIERVPGPVYTLVWLSLRNNWASICIWVYPLFSPCVNDLWPFQVRRGNTNVRRHTPAVSFQYKLSPSFLVVASAINTNLSSIWSNPRYQSGISLALLFRVQAKSDSSSSSRTVSFYSDSQVPWYYSCC